MFEDSEMFSNKSSPETLFLSKDIRKGSYKVDDSESGEKMTIKVGVARAPRLVCFLKM
jgi:hypothetical protein